MKNSNWDLDLRAGEVGEMKLADLLSMDTIEVKTDRRWHETGNLYIETECFQQSTRTWEDSGISVSKATHWAFVLEDGVIILPTFRLKDAIVSYGKTITCEIPPNFSRGFLVTPIELLESIRQAKVLENKDMDEHFAETWTDPHEWGEGI